MNRQSIKLHEHEGEGVCRLTIGIDEIARLGRLRITSRYSSIVV